MARKTDDELAVALGAKPAAGLAKLSAADRKRLAQTIEDARDRQAEAVVEAVEEALDHIPWPLRGAVRKLLDDGAE